jgi:hypothetical protein
MATFHTHLPKDEKGYHGEYEFAQALSRIDDPELEAWFQIGYLPQVPEQDCIIFHPQAGVFLVETKGVKIDAIAKYNFTEFVLFPNVKKQHPVEQVRTGQIRLKNYLLDFYRKKKSTHRVPFIQTSVAWPMITRSEWEKYFDDERIVMQGKSMIFKDDLASMAKLLSRLKRFKDAPLLGTFALNNAIPDVENIALTRSALAPTAVPENSNDSLAAEIRRDVVYSKQLALSFPPPKKYNVSFEGAPGTGKSTVLREIGLLHAAAGGTVLHVCFNKALAADQRREYELLKAHGIEYGVIEVFDEWDLYKAMHPNWSPGNLAVPGQGPRPASEIAGEIIAAKNTPDGHPDSIYDTILIDESQDISESLFKILEYVARPTASWFISYGEGQEIFFFNEENPAPFLKKWFETADRQKLRRSFRNSTRAFLMSQNFWENYPDLEKSSQWFDKKLIQSSSESSALELELDIPKDTNDFRTVRLSEPGNRLSAIKQILLEVIEDARRARRGSDVLIVVGKPDSRDNDTKSNYNLVMEALSELGKLIDLDVLDLIPAENRRNTPKEGTIRITRYQSVRGLSASHVVLFDLPELDEWCNAELDDAKRKRGPIRNYGQIALSRSRASTVVVLEDGARQIEDFIEKTLIMLREKYLAATNKVKK